MTCYDAPSIENYTIPGLIGIAKVDYSDGQLHSARETTDSNESVQ